MLARTSLRRCIQNRLPNKLTHLQGARHFNKMNSIQASEQPTAGQVPKQMSYLPHLKLNDGNEIPMLAYGLGTARSKSSGSSKLDSDIVKAAVTAIKAGFVHLDGAESYSNDAELGEAVRESKLPREQLYIVGKFSPKEDKPVEESFAATLKAMGTDYLDLYLMHSPFFARGNPQLLQKKWAEMEAIKESGRARSIGVSNYIADDLEIVLQTAKISPALNQIEFHPYLQHEGLLDYCHDKNIAVSSYSGLVPITKAQGGPIDGVLSKMAKKYGVTEGEVIQRWIIDQGVIVITTSAKEQRLKSLLSKLPSFKLTPKEVEEISAEGNKKHYRNMWAKVIDPIDRR